MRTTTMATPTSAVVLRRNRRSPWVSDASERSTRAGHAIPGTTASSASGVLPPLMGRTFAGIGCRPSAMRPLRVADARIQEGIRQIDEKVHHDEGERRQQGEALHLLVVARDDRVDAEGPEAG